jgi:hypothetical protein
MEEKNVKNGKAKTKDETTVKVDEKLLEKAEENVPVEPQLPVISPDQEKVLFACIKSAIEITGQGFIAGQNGTQIGPMYARLAASEVMHKVVNDISTIIGFRLPHVHVKPVK